MVAPDSDARARKAVKQAEKVEKLFRQWEEDTIHSLLKTVEGRQFIWWLLSIGKAGQGTQPFVAGQADQTAFNCGEQNVGNQILDRIIALNPQGYLRLLEDQHGRRTEPSEPGTSLDDTSGAEPEPAPGTDGPASSRPEEYP